MIYSPNQDKKEILLKIKTVVIDEEAVGDIAEELARVLQALADTDDADFDSSEFDSLLSQDNSDEIELCTEATICTDENGNIEISYRENEDDKQLSTLSKIIFHPESPDLVVMTKSGAVETALSFEEGKTHICEYQTPFMPFKMYINSSCVKNTLLQNGKLKLDYILNINDTAPQHFIITAKISEAPEDLLKDYFK